MKKWLFIVIAMVVLPSSVWSQNDAEQRQKEEKWREIESWKVAFFTHELRITSEEAVLFWPLYNEMTSQLQALYWQKRNLRRSLFNKDQQPSEEQCQTVLRKILEIDRQRDELKYTSYKKMIEVIPASKLLRLEDVEERFRQKLFEKLRKHPSPHPPVNN